MSSFNHKYKETFSDNKFIISLFAAILFLLISLILNFYAGTYATESASTPVTDVILSNFPVYDVDAIFIYGPFFLWFFVTGLGIFDPKKIPFIVKSIALFLIIRSVFVSLTHIGPFPDQIMLTNPIGIIGKFTFGGDLFFSAHTGLPFLMAQIYWENRLLRTIFIITSIFFGVIVLLGHFHYSIDVLSAFFITYSIYRLAEIFFHSDKLRFRS